MSKNRAAAAILLLAVSWQANAAVSIASPSTTYTQNFDALGAASGSSPVVRPWVNDSTLVGWSLFNSLGDAPATYRAEIGNQDIGSFVSYGGNPQGANSSERALGSIGAGNAYFGSPAEGAVAGYIAVAFRNDSGSPLDSFALRFAGEQWRHSTAAAQTMVLEYGLGASFAAVDNWLAPGGLFDWSSPLSGVGAGGIDGNATGRVNNRGGAQSLSWAPGQTLWIRWIERNEAGADHGMAIDDLSFSVTAVPEPGAWALMLGGMAALGALARRRCVVA